EPQLGTGHALITARDAWSRHPERTLLVLAGDTPLLTSATLKRLLEHHDSHQADATILSCELDDPAHYGRIVRDAEGAVTKIVEARDASRDELCIHEINSGVYAFRVGSLSESLMELKSNNAQQEYYLTDVIALLNKRTQRVLALRVEAPQEILGVNSMAELAEAQRLIRDRRLAELMANGVRFEDPATTWVGLDVEIAPDAYIRAGSQIEGRTSIGANTIVGPYSRIESSCVAQDVQILDHCLVRESVIAIGASIGPFAHIRPASQIGARARVGNFVELKKTALGEGSKAPHLSYLGDAQIEANVNVGAGTITCNYDGAHKHPTRIAENAFIGSDSTLVAPLTIGAGAYIGAGSTITEDVPAGALALGRARQVVKPEWARARKARHTK
ncbi:MAG: bifunctional UDP-N-acetylglucosamine diphosphorylase/glucosamine-1-phosphate N-acetyltransferase GlmU, partial [Vicinamibacteria bacterium]|nr:bifunctional UDP-N-acetylglucosamine diphosphorylase/glucosamine-1-phosphate N-acetyltransferase GlmU [Vicinamibacteria bacterium]